MYTLNRILFPVDFYHDESHALRHVRSLIDPKHAEIIFLHIVNERDEEARAVEAEQASEQWLEKLVATGSSMGLRCRAEIQEGVPKYVITEQAARAAADCVAISTGGRFAVDRMIEPSLCMEIIRASDVPVMAITPTMDPPRPQGADETLPRTIVCTVEENGGVEALDAALGIALPIRATVIAIHPGTNISDRLREQVQDRFGREPYKNLRGGVSCTRGHTTDDLVSAARAVDAHLFVMASALDVSSRLLSNASTTESLISLCDCPVLALPSMVRA